MILDELRELIKAEKEERRLIYTQYPSIANRTEDERKQLIKNKRRLRINRKKQLITDMGGQCADCKGVFPVAAYDFHHLDGKKEAMGLLWSAKEERRNAEAAKCILLCANCHRIRHHPDEEIE